MINSLLLKVAIEIVDVPIKHGDFPVRYVCNICRRHFFGGFVWKGTETHGYAVRILSIQMAISEYPEMWRATKYAVAVSD
jgi:uncharacterized membrane protein YoaT (DUF817 family)